MKLQRDFAIEYFNIILINGTVMGTGTINKLRTLTYGQYIIKALNYNHNYS